MLNHDWSTELKRHGKSGSRSKTVRKEALENRAAEYFFSDSGLDRDRKIIPSFLRGLGGVKIC